MKRVLTYGTFDLFHIGHLNLLRRAKELGDYLIVGVSTDEFNEIKGKISIIPYKERQAIIRAIRYVDEVIAENSWEQKIEDIKKYKIDILVMGEDWRGEFDYLSSYCEVVYLPRTKNISSTALKNKMKYLVDIDINKVQEAIAILKKIVDEFQ